MARELRNRQFLTPDEILELIGNGSTSDFEDDDELEEDFTNSFYEELVTTSGWSAEMNDDVMQVEVEQEGVHDVQVQEEQRVEESSPVERFQTRNILETWGKIP